ncbi:MAG: NAD(P)H-hydrate dehydratase [Piscirickettsiaceae bacterium]|nr:MAG: NAD(P)H-hydrate dehydratase [Piscirickettsiaceae bacterium]PCI70967.1 MAG: NAD(P)H-hydrate dehydratase [Piscirickettsiaceae bacterium]
MATVQTTDVMLLSFSEMKKSLSVRLSDAHKGDFGHVLMVGGTVGFVGAICLAGEAALRVGSGLVSVATRMEHAALITMARPELMCQGVETQLDLNRLSRGCHVLAVGPGLGQSAWSQRLFAAALESQVVMVVDADGLNLLSKEPLKREDWILTPHVGEAARLLDCSTSDIQQNRVEAIVDLQKKYGGVVVLKGSGSLVFDGGDQVFKCEAGNPGMASGGMGDVLTGVIAGLVAQGHNLLEAAKLGVVVHAMAGDRAAIKGEKGLLASDLMPHIRELVNEN